MEATDFHRKSHQILTWLETAEQRLVTRVNRALKGAGLPFAQFVILNHLASLPAEGWTVTGLAAALETGQPGVSKILRRLAAKGHVRIDADPGDRRVRRHRLTQAGKAAHREAFRRVAPQASDIFSGWPDGDIDALHGLLYKLKSSLRDEPVRPITPAV
ncbi:MAG: MarR family transcriptional regulator [Gammaproteobacteria bacterium]|nr:MAG: MarR family transcriptional regulator [Gammaproteobacteria bacterium]